MKLLTSSIYAAIGASFFAFSAPAQATDLLPGLGDAGHPAPPEYVATQDDWTGLHFDVFGGWAWVRSKGPYSYDDNSPSVERRWGEFDDGDKSISDNNWFAGVGLGGDQRFGNVVAGVVVDASISDLNQTDTFIPYPEKDSVVSWNTETEIEYFGTARARLGYLLKDNFLVYGTGGLAWAKTQSSIEAVYNAETPDENIAAKGSSENNHIGWTAGAGFEWLLSEHVSFTTEYLYMDLGKQDYRFDGTTTGGRTYATDNYHPDLNMHAVKAGLNYRF